MASIPHPLHLYRHLLREASYLPPVCRPFVAERITTRFHKNRRDAAPSKIRQAHRSLRYLRAANTGDMSRMRRVLLLAFGRTGRRRRELMQGLARRDPPVDSAALQELVNEAAARVDSETPSDWLSRWDLPKLRAFVASQAQAHLNTSPRPTLKSSQTNPHKSIPTENAWSRPLHPRLARSKLRKAWKKLIDRALPPVGRGEWDLLRGLAEGKVQGPEWQVPQRRPVGGHKKSPLPWNWTRYASQPVRQAERHNSRPLKLLSGSDDAPGSAPAKRHTYTARFWRRLYAHVWRLTPTMEEKPGGWDVQWGRPSGDISAAGSGHAEFFEGVTAEGKRGTQKAS